MMRLWRLAARPFGHRLDGGYGRHHAGRWNLKGQLVTYCTTTPTLSILEQILKVEDPALLPDELLLVEMWAPDSLPATVLEEGDPLPEGWQRDIAISQVIGTAWYESRRTALLKVPSVITPTPKIPDRNVVLNHTHPGAADVRIVHTTPFALDHRLIGYH